MDSSGHSLGTRCCRPSPCLIPIDETDISVQPSMIPINASLCRGTTPDTILGGFGRRLRETAGGIGCDATRGADDEYARSVQVDELDVFLSHSWHSIWWQKYALLLLEWNVKPAILATVSAGVLSSLGCPLRATYFGDGQACSTFGLPFMSYVLAGIGIFSFIITLLSWHHISGHLGMKHKLVFFDKVCIHQTDPVQKERGIRAIGGVLERSKCMLVAWDPSYFRRLWCVHELSAFKKTHPDRQVLIRTASLGNFVLSFACLSMTMYCLTHVHISHKRVSFWIYFCLALLVLPSFFASLRKYSSERRSLKTRLASFSVRESLCFCCTHGHVHPETKQSLMCDRELVYDNIAIWYGNGDRDLGLDEFDHMIRGALKEDLHSSLGKSWNIPYVYTLVVGLLPFLLRLGRGCYSCAGKSGSVGGGFEDWLVTVCAAFELLLLRFPIGVVFALVVCDTAPSFWASGALNRLVDMVVTCVCAFIIYMVSELDLWERVDLTVRLAIEAPIVISFYVVLARMHWHRHIQGVKESTVEMRRTVSELVHRAPELVAKGDPEVSDHGVQRTRTAPSRVG